MRKDGARERGKGNRAEEGATERGRGARDERRRNGDREGGTLQGRYPEKDTGQYTVYSTQHTKQHATRPLPLRRWYYKYKIVNGYINSVL